MSYELQALLAGKEIAPSQTTSHNPEGNGLVEIYNGVVWKVVKPSVKSKNVNVKYWQDLLSDVPHSIPSLPCTATNETLHEHFFQYP